MTETLIALLGITSGIISANLTGYFLKQFSLGLTGNTLAGVFGSIFAVKSTGHLGINPSNIVQSGHFDGLLFVVFMVVSVSGGLLAVVIAGKILKRINALNR